MSDTSQRLMKRVGAAEDLMDWLDRKIWFGSGLSVILRVGSIEFNTPGPIVSFEIAGPDEGRDVLSTCLKSLHSDLCVTRTLARKEIEALGEAIRSADKVNSVIEKRAEKENGKSSPKNQN